MERQTHCRLMDVGEQNLVLRTAIKRLKNLECKKREEISKHTCIYSPRKNIKPKKEEEKICICIFNECDSALVDI
jgi:hypothetical protein